MTATYTWDVFSTVDGYGSFEEGAGWGGYWSEQGPELLAHRARLFDPEPRMVYGATTFRENAEIRAAGVDPNALDEWNRRMWRAPATVIASTPVDTAGWDDVTVVRGDATEILAELKRTSDRPLRSQASLTLNWALLTAGLVDLVQVTVFPVLTGRTGTSPVLRGVGDLRLDLVTSTLLDGRTQELVYRPRAG